MSTGKNARQEAPRFLIIPAAGLGTRMRTVDPGLPKELLPVGDKPAIQYAIEEGLSAGIKDIIIIISRQKEILRQRIEEIYRNSGSISFSFLYQKDLSGEADAIGCARDIAEGHAVAIIYPDNLYVPAPGALTSLKTVFKGCGQDVIALNEVTEGLCRTLSNAGRADVVRRDENIYSITRFLPKGAGHFQPRFRGELRCCGISLLGPHLFAYIERAQSFVREGEFTDIYFRQLIMEEQGMTGCKLPGIVFDIGNPAGYAQCNEYIRRVKGPRDSGIEG